MEGRIVKNISNDYTVNVNGKLYECKPRGKFRISKLTPMVGDIVDIDINNNYILDIKERKNSLIRPVVANVDKAIIITSVKPKLDLNLLDKLLIVINYNNIEPIICFSKLDLLDSSEKENVDDIINYYKSIGYNVICNYEIDKLKSVLKNNVCVFVGQSGAGKSTLLNKIDSNLSLKTDEISLALGRGKHTTRHTELYEVCSGFVVDTPGFSSLDINDLSNTCIRDNMKEMFDGLDMCKYRDCMHFKEDGCYIKKQVEEGKIMNSRYTNYLSFLRK